MGKPVDDRIVESIERIAHIQRDNVPLVTTELVDILDNKGVPTGEQKEQYKAQYRHIVEIYYCLKNANGEFLVNADPVPHATVLTDVPEVADNYALVDLIESQWFKEDTLKFSGNVI